jgi:RNA polymerase sigma factor (sigma-70 family)
MTERQADRARGNTEQLLRELVPHVLGAVVRRFGDFAAAEDAVQEALLAAVADWRAGGVPVNPGGWLYHVACRRMLDHRREEAARRRREEAAAPGDAPAASGAGEAGGDPAEDDTLVLLFMCCHPALTPSSAVALTLRAVGGLTTAEIARAFLVPEATMAQRISRAKQAIAGSGLPFALPTPRERAERLAAVLHVLYLVFSEGYASGAGARLQRVELAAEAIRLARVLQKLLPEEAEVGGLLALMLLTDARRRARTGPHGELVPLHEQDRSLWDRAAIAEGSALVTACFARGAVGPYQLQAAVAALHDEAPSVEATDWPQILALYGVLQRLSDNPMVALNRAVAAAMVDGPEHGLALLDELEGDARIAGHYRLDAVRAHLLERAGRRQEAAARYRAAAAATASLPERQYLLAKAAGLAGP